MTDIIASAQNKVIKTVSSLKQKKYRDVSGQFIVEGVRLVEEAVNSDWDIELCFYTQDALRQERVKEVLSRIHHRNFRLIEVTADVFKRISDTEEPQGILAVVIKREYNLDQVMHTTDNPIFVVLDELQDPGNVGTVIRTAAAVGCTAVLLTKGCADVFAMKTVRSSMGSLFNLPIYQGLSNQDVINLLENYNISVFATSLAASDLYFNMNFNRPIAIIFGNEGKGVSEELLRNAEARIHIPLLGKVESLNVAASAAVILYEAVRQRR